MRKVDVLIVGAGPAGSTCAYLLQKAGVSCLLIDQATFPRDKLCGGGLTPRCWKLLEELIPGIQYEYNSIRRVCLEVEGFPPCPFEASVELRLVKRKEFDKLLLDTYKSVGGEFQKASFLRYEEVDDGVIVTLKSGEQVQCRYLVGADGATSAVRHQLKGCRDKGLLIMEQYVEKSADNALVVGMSPRYAKNGYFYRFPNSEFDAVGYGDVNMTPDKFRQILQQKHIPELKFRGCYIYLRNDYPLNDRIILIGDAGGFANRVTCEGIKSALETANAAAEAIISGRPFRQVNASKFEKLKKEDRFNDFFYKPSSVKLLGQISRFPSLVRWCFDRVLRP